MGSTLLVMCWHASKLGSGRRALDGSRRAAAVVGRDVPTELLRGVVDLPGPETHAALLAHHYEDARENLEAARWHERAGRRVARSQPAAGLGHCQRVAQLLAGLPESRETLMLGLTSRIARLEIGRIAGIEEREARNLFEEARTVAERLGDRAGRAFLLTYYGRLCGLAGDVGQYLACAERTDSCARCAGCGAISPARALTAAGQTSWRTSAEVRSPGSRPRTPSPPNWAPTPTGCWRKSSAPASRERCRVASPQSSRGGTACQPSG